MANQCRFCGKEVLGVSVCACQKVRENEILWDKELRRYQKKLGRKHEAQTT